MSNEIKPQAAVELTEQDLDAVAGGLAVSIGDVESLLSDESTFFKQTHLKMMRETVSGPGGSSAGSAIDFTTIDTGSGQGLILG